MIEKYVRSLCSLKMRLGYVVYALHTSYFPKTKSCMFLFFIDRTWKLFTIFMYVHMLGILDVCRITWRGINVLDVICVFFESNVQISADASRKLSGSCCTRFCELLSTSICILCKLILGLRYTVLKLPLKIILQSSLWNKETALSSQCGMLTLFTYCFGVSRELAISGLSE